MFTRGRCSAIFFERPYETKLSEEQQIILDNVYNEYSVIDSTVIIKMVQKLNGPWYPYSHQGFAVIPNEVIRAYYEREITKLYPKSSAAAA